MRKKEVDFEHIKSILLNKSAKEMDEFIRSPEKFVQEEAMFLFWALDFLDQHKGKDITYSASHLENNRQILMNAQKTIFEEELSHCLSQFSAGFVVGALEFAIREREAQIDRYSEYKKLLSKLKAWPELGFPNEEFQKHWEKRFEGIQEIYDWMDDRAKEWFPIILQIINSGKWQKTKKIIKILQKRGRNDNVVFQILAGVLHANPILDIQIKKYCVEKQIPIEELTGNFWKTLRYLAQTTEDDKVKKSCQLLLKSKKRENDE
ncbi:MAG: hypothetical protein ACXAC8_08195 [Candidatus Hodarchaeales archaeon]